MTTDEILDQAAQFVRGFMSSTIWRLSPMFGSPIEEMFAAALLYADALAPESQRITLVGRYVAYGQIDVALGEGILCWPQASVGDYRVDFLLCQKLLGETRWLIVECDGHDFHERTREQVARDKKRDRYFTAIGLPKVHYTGSEINASPILCAMEALDALWPVSENG